MKYIDIKYINMLSYYLKKFKQINHDLYNFRCPYCGDSTQNQHKARGYIFLKDNTYIYKCHNCGITKNLKTFLKDVDTNIFNEYNLEKFKIHLPKNKETVDKDKFKTKVDFSHNENLGNKLLNKMKNAIDSDEGYEYLKNRGFTDEIIKRFYYISDINILTKRVEKYKNTNFKKVSAIVIPFIQNKIVTHLQLRIIDSDSKLRYITLEMYSMDNKIYGLDYINYDETVYVFEGVFDSVFCNGVALANGNLHTSKKDLDKIFKHYVLVYDKDLITNKDILASVNKSIENGNNVLLYDKKVIESEYKDINDLMKYGIITDLNIYLKNNTYNGLKAKMYLNEIKKIGKTKSKFNKVSIL